MNQILYTIEDENRNNKMKSVVLFFCIFLIIFGLALTATGGYNIYASNVKRQERIELAKIPQIELTESDNKIIINVQHSRVVRDIIYSWNDGEEKVISENKQTGIRETIDVPVEANTLFVKVTDEKGISSTTEGEFSYKGTYIDPVVIGNKRIRITAIDNAGLQSLSYNWDSEEAVMKEADNISTKKIEVETEIPIGIHSIQIKTVNNNNETITKEIKKVQGITKPTIERHHNTDKTLFTIKFKDDQGIASYSYTLYSAPIADIMENQDNFKEKLVKVTENTVEGNGELEIIDKVALVDGFNWLEISVKNVEGLETTDSGWSAK